MAAFALKWWIFRAFIRLRRELVAINILWQIGTSKHLELFVRATPDTHRSAFKQAQARIQIDGHIVWQVGRWLYRQVIGGLMGIMFYGNDGQLALHGLFQPFFAIDHLGIFANGHAVDDGYRMHSHKTRVRWLQYGSIHVMSIGIWPVQNQQWHIGLDT